MSYVKYTIPDDLKTKIKNLLSDVADKDKTKDGKIRKGMNEVTKSIERKTAKLVVMAEDVSPPEILFHVPLICEENGIPYAYLSTKKELGNAVRINVSSSAVAIENCGTGNENALEDVLKKLEALFK